MKIALPWMFALFPVALVACHFFFRWAERSRERRLGAFLGGAYEKKQSALAGKVWTPRRYYLALFLFFLCAAAARPFLPADEKEKEDRQRVGVDFLIAIDASKSMWARDTETSEDFRKQLKDRLISLFKKKSKDESREKSEQRKQAEKWDLSKPLSRLDASKEAVRKLLKEAQGDRIGIIAFSQEAAMRAPLTYDFAALNLVLDSIDPRNVPPGGSSLEPAVVRAQRMFEDKNLKRPMLVILSDGEEFEGNSTGASAEFRAKLNGAV